MATVVPCASCERFIRASAEECPFCGSAHVPADVKLRRPHIARAAIVALALASCGGPGHEAVPAYGAPPPDDTSDTSGGDTADPGEGVEDVEDVDPGPTDDANDTGEMDDGSVVVPLYGAPAPQE